MSLFSGATLGEGTGATMSDDDDDLHPEMPLDVGFDGHDMMGFGPLFPTESERSLMERVRQELKIELKQVSLYISFNNDDTRFHILMIINKPLVLCMH